MDDVMDFDNEVAALTERFAAEMEVEQGSPIIANPELLAIADQKRGELWDERRRIDAEVRQQVPTRTGRRNVPLWARSDRSIVEHIFGAERLQKLRRKLFDNYRARARGAREILDLMRALATLELSDEKRTQAEIAIAYYRKNVSAEAIAEMRGKNISAVESIIWRLNNPITPVRSTVSRKERFMSTAAMSPLPILNLKPTPRYSFVIADELHAAYETYHRGLVLVTEGYKLVVAGRQFERPVDELDALLAQVLSLDSQLEPQHERIATLERELDAAEAAKPVEMEASRV